MNESHFVEIERALLVVSEARQRLERTAKAIAKDGAEPHLVEALEEAAREIDETLRRLMQGTYFAVPADQLTL